MAKSITGFRDFVLMNSPNISKTDLAKLNEFVAKKQQEEAITAFVNSKINPSEIPTDPIQQAVALEQIQTGTYQPKSDQTNVTVRKEKNLATSGLRAVDEVEQIYKKDPNIIVKQLVPGKFFSRQYDSALFQAVDALLRLRTGAVAPETEVRRYMKAYGPTFGDDAVTAAYKINSLRQSLSDVSPQAENKSNKNSSDPLGLGL